MCCVFATLAILGPRFGIFLWWLYNPARWSLVFSGGFIVPLLGFLILPLQQCGQLSLPGRDQIQDFSW